MNIERLRELNLRYSHEELVAKILEFESALNQWADNCDCDCDACRDLADHVPAWKDCPTAFDASAEVKG